MAGQAIAAQPVRGSAAEVGARPIERAVPPIPWLLWILGLSFALAAVGVVSMLVYKHFTHAEIPGCHAGSACDQLDSHPLGRIMFPGGLAAAAKFDKWPTSFIGLAYYAAVALAQILRALPLRNVARLGRIGFGGGQASGGGGHYTVVPRLER